MQLITHDGLALEVLRTQAQAGTVVFVNALGIGNAVTLDLAQALQAAGVGFVTWDRRGLPGAYDDRFREYSLDDQVRDLECLMATLDPGPVVIAAWCTGIHTALAYARKWPDRLEALLLFNSPNFFNSRYSGVAGDAIGKVSRILVDDESKLDFMYHTIFANNTEQTATRLTGLADTRIRGLVEAPFKSGPQALLRYMYLIQSAAQPEVDHQWCAPIRVPALVIGGRQDTMVSFQDSLSLGEVLPAAQVRIMDDWGHYTLLSDTQESVSKVMLGFLQTLEAFDCRTVAPACLTPFTAPSFVSAASRQGEADVE
ncbi:alpha/beta fold hydrolase [Pseudomonas poae]|uniref:alpha/beta fold hydrolase n=1 Tax=Pseudomonas poae TaxID=200451 RepID=UPI001472DC83|nr:alpha/beta hydrolase [Pseudomonas poae]NMZ50373.1 alpha/beta hydrolase [Pseudomonas poae]